MSLRGNIKSFVCHDGRTVNGCPHIDCFYLRFLFSMIKDKKISILIAEKNFIVCYQCGSPYAAERIMCPIKLPGLRIQAVNDTRILGNVDQTLMN